jgi:hypothetical protein
VKHPKPPHPVTQIIVDLYGSQIEFSRKQKISRPTAKKYMTNPESMPFGMVVKLCKRAGININLIIKPRQGGSDE